MTDEQPPHTPMAAPPPLPPVPPVPPPPPPPSNDMQDTLGGGVFEATIWVVGGTVVALTGFFGVINALPRLIANSTSFAIGLFTVMLAAPWALVLALGIRYARQGRTRAAKGMWLGLGIIAAFGLLLFAACFGMVQSWQ